MECQHLRQYLTLCTTTLATANIFLLQQEEGSCASQLSFPAEKYEASKQKIYVAPSSQSEMEQFPFTQPLVMMLFLSQSRAHVEDERQESGNTALSRSIRSPVKTPAFNCGGCMPTGQSNHLPKAPPPSTTVRLSFVCLSTMGRRFEAQVFKTRMPLD